MIDFRENAKWTVYIHIVPKEISGYDWDKYYIGITSQKPELRWGKNGLRYINHHQYFKNAIIKYGWDNIQHEIFAEYLTKEEACNMEMLLIQKLQSNNKLYGYNVTSGGEGTCGLEPVNKGKLMSEEQKEKLSNAIKLHYKNMSSEENPCSKSIICLNNLNIYHSSVEALKHVGGSITITSCCRNERHSAGVDENGIPLIWMWYDIYRTMSKQEIDEYIVKKLSLTKCRAIVNLETKEVFSNIKFVAPYYGRGGSSSYIIKKMKINCEAYGFHWQYFTDYLTNNNLTYDMAKTSLTFVA